MFISITIATYITIHMAAPSGLEYAEKAMLTTLDIP